MNILIVGDGDFSFSRSVFELNLENIIIYTSCIESFNEICTKYTKAKENIDFIISKNGNILYEVDATHFENPYINLKFDSIIFNFPHIGGKSNVKLNRLLLKNFFCSIQKSNILKYDGVVCVSLCKGQGGTKADIDIRDFKNSWQIEEMAAKSNFLLIDILRFKSERFGYYVSTGFRSQEKCFLVDNARTYVLKSCGSLKNNKLFDEIEYEGTKYFVLKWISSIWKKKNQLMEKFIECVKYDVSSPIKEADEASWCLVLNNEYIDQCYDKAYRVVLVELESGYSDDEVGRMLLFGECGDFVTKSILCCFVWQQVEFVLLSGRAPRIGNRIYLEGPCFYPVNLSGVVNEICMEHFLLTMECCTSEEFYDNTERTRYHFSDGDKPFFVNPNISVIHFDITTTNLLGSTWEVQELTICYERRFFLIRVFNLTKQLEQLDIPVPYQVWDLDNLLNINSCYRSVLVDTELGPVGTTNYQSFMDLVDKVKRRIQLDVCYSRDISFWCGETKFTLEQIMEIIGELLRAVMCDHVCWQLHRRVTLLDRYQHEGTTDTGLCIRMGLCTGPSRCLSLEKINILQSQLRIFVEKLLVVTLR